MECDDSKGHSRFFVSTQFQNRVLALGGVLVVLFVSSIGAGRRLLAALNGEEIVLEVPKRLLHKTE
ncbi:MAG: hypothetical protein U0894_01135 [Pirellulales bacterium]